MRPRFNRLFMIALCLATTAAVGQEMPSPGPEHERLKKEVGVWDAAVKMWSAPDTDPMEWNATETATLQTGGFWLLTAFKGDLNGTEFVGNSTTGYDPAKKKYISVWTDSMTPALTITEGNYNDSTHELTMLGEMPDPAGGKPAKMRTVTKYSPQGDRTMSMYITPDGGTEFKMMEVAYTKRAGK